MQRATRRASVAAVVVLAPGRVVAAAPFWWVASALANGLLYWGAVLLSAAVLATSWYFTARRPSLRMYGLTLPTAFLSGWTLLYLLAYPSMVSPLGWARGVVADLRSAPMVAVPPPPRERPRVRNFTSNQSVSVVPAGGMPAGSAVLVCSKKAGQLPSDCGR